MKTQNKLIIASAVLIILIGIIFVTGADELIINSFSKSISIDKTQRDFLLTKVPEIEGKAQKEIKPVVTIDCNKEYCKWSAVQEGLLNSYDNIIKKEYCKEKDEKNKINCFKYEIYTDEEIENLVSEKIASMLSKYADNNIKSNPYVKVSEGTIEVIEKK